MFRTSVTILVFLIITGCEASFGRNKANKEFEVAHYWNYINFTWPSLEAYQSALRSKRYIPENIGISGIKIYKENIYITLPRFLPGSPVTLASFPITSRKDNPLLVPYPSWEQNVGESCSTLQNVQAVEVDTSGILWVLDANRFNNLTKCPPKIVLLDLKNNGAVVQTYEVPCALTPHPGGWLNDLVIDETDGGYAYISEVSSSDPGLIVYSRTKNKGWKLRDRTMFQEMEAAGYVVGGVTMNGLYSIDGIALAPTPKRKDEDRLVYYSALTGFSIYAISTKTIKNEEYVTRDSAWRGEVQLVTGKRSITDGMIVDNEGNLYFGMIDKYSIAKWNIYKKPFNKYAQVLYTNHTTVNWPDSFGFDSDGNLYLTADGSERFLNATAHPPPPKDGIYFRILKYHTGTQSYLYS